MRLLERAQIETQLFSEFVSKMVGAHSVKDIRTMYEECAKHQIQFVRRDCDWLLKKGLQENEWVFSATSERWEHACEHLEPQIFLVA